MPGDLGYPQNQTDPDSEKGKGVMAEKILIVVDMQKDFVNGSLGSKDAEAIVPAVVSCINRENICLRVEIIDAAVIGPQPDRTLPVFVNGEYG